MSKKHKEHADAAAAVETNAANRLFIALEAPLSLKKAIAAHEKKLPFWRWTPQANLHLTLRFIGETSQEDTLRLAKDFDIAFARTRIVRFTHTGCGFFPSTRKAVSMHLEMQRSHAMEELKERVDEYVSDILGLPPETRAFQAHVTIMRMKKPPVFYDLDKLVKWGSEFKAPEPFAEKLTLFKSICGRDGSEYVPLAEYSFD